MKIHRCVNKLNKKKPRAAAFLTSLTAFSPMQKYSIISGKNNYLNNQAYLLPVHFVSKRDYSTLLTWFAVKEKVGRNVWRYE